jgi:uncharacterized SAM-binding protein YcdF (DUF218 family)
MRLKKRWRIVVSVLVPVLLVIGVPAWFLLPPREMAVPSDAVVVLAGASDGRHQLGAQLVEEGTAENFVVSNPRGAGDRVGSAHCRGQDRPEGAAEVWCLRPEPVNTAGEAMTVGELAAEEGWSELTVVTNRPHNRRVRTMFEHCTDLEVTVVSSQWVNKVRVPYHVAREVAGYMKFWITDPCGD